MTEREAIVAWLRQGAHHGPSCVIISSFQETANAIQRGEHLSKPEHD